MCILLDVTNTFQYVLGWNTKVINPILTGGVNLTPPVRNPRLPRDTPFVTFSFKSYASFDTKFAKIGPSVARSHDVLYSHVGTKFAQKSAFCIYVCVQNTWKLLIFLKCTKQCLFCLFGHLHNFLYLEINQDQITKIKNHKNNEIHKK